MSGRGRVGVVAAGVAVVVAAVLAARGCGDDAGESAGASSVATGPSALSAPRERQPRVRASATKEPFDTASEPKPSGEPFLVDGWPAAQVIVRWPDGRAASDAAVYVHRADADTPPSLDEVVRGRTDAGGKLTIVAPESGRYDVGAFYGPGFATLRTDVEFPARTPLEIVLPETARLEVGSEGELPRTGSVSIWASAAARVTAFPGRREAKYIGFGTDRPLPKGIDVPRGVPLRIDTRGGVVVDPSTVMAPGTITVRPDGTQPAGFEFVFTGVSPPPDIPLQYVLEVEAVGGGIRFATKYSGRSPGGPVVAPLRVKDVWCVPGSVEVRWNLVGVAEGTSVVDTSRRSDDAAFRVEIPVPDWSPCLPTQRVMVTGGDGQWATVVSDRSLLETVDVGLEARFFARGDVHFAAVGLLERPVLVADPVAPAIGSVLDLRLVPGGTVRVTIEWSRPLGAGWPITLERADGLPILMRDPPGRIGPLLAARARIDGVRLTIGPLAAGEVELVFRLAGREFGRKRVTVRPDETVELIGPPILPPGPR